MYLKNMETIDQMDRALLRIVQKDANLSVEEVGAAVGLSRNACWRRLRRMEEAGIITGRVVLVDPDAIGCGLCVLVSVRTDRHDAKWAGEFATAVRNMPEVVGAYRTSGDIDYILRVRVEDVKSYDAFYQRLIEKVELKDVSARFVMEEIKETTALPV